DPPTRAMLTWVSLLMKTHVKSPDWKKVPTMVPVLSARKVKRQSAEPTMFTLLVSVLPFSIMRVDLIFHGLAVKRCVLVTVGGLLPPLPPLFGSVGLGLSFLQAVKAKAPTRAKSMVLLMNFMY